MGTSKTTYWVVGAALLALLVVGGGWMLLIQPQLQAASDTRSEADQVEAQNLVQQDQVDALRVQFENISTFEARLAQMQEQIPTEDELIEFNQTIVDLSIQHGVLVTATTAAGGEPVIPVTPAPAPEAAPAPADDTVVEAADSAAEATDEQTETTEGAGAPAPTDPVVDAVEGLISIPVSVSVLGTAENARAFADSLQTTIPRLLLVEKLTSTALPEADAAEGKPATVLGDVELTISGYIFVLRGTAPSADAPGEEPDEPAEIAPLPQPSGTNPFAPNKREN